MTKYFKSFDTLRAFAAFIVMWSHLELIKGDNNLPNLHNSNFWFMPGGHIAVVFFFVLSGFLITYLLIKEKDKTGEIKLKDFYMRRIFRIWPLYYLIILLSFIFVKADRGIFSIFSSLTLFPNIPYALKEAWIGSPQIWSIGVEEQFYLFWPILLLKIPDNKIFKFLIVFFILYTFLPYAIYLFNINTIQSGKLAAFSSSYFYSTKFNCMALGAVFGYIYIKRTQLLSFFTKNITVYFFISLSLVLTFSRIRFPFFNDELFSIIYGLMIYGLAGNDLKIGNKLTSFLGRISYGLYMYHWLVFLFVIKFLPRLTDLVYYNISLYFISFSLTILISWISFNTIEKYFLKIKNRYNTI